MLPLVSICIPSYNSALFIEQTLKSVLNQSYKNIEVIVVDDLSKDDTVGKVKLVDDKRIKLFVNETNLGVSQNWNRSIELASGEYIKIMGADDLLEPTCIEEQLNVFLHNKNNIVLVTSYKNVINQNNKHILYKKTFNTSLIKGSTALKLSAIDGTNLIGEPVAGLFKKTDFIKVGKYNSIFLYLIDMDLWKRLFTLGDLYVIHKPLYSFRISKSSLSSLLKSSQISEFNRFTSTLIKENSIHLNFTENIRAKVNCFVKGMLRKVVLLFFV
jgi:glycosyltransferase involved in cell wall biosynthesis